MMIFSYLLFVLLGAIFMYLYMKGHYHKRQYYKFNYEDDELINKIVRHFKGNLYLVIAVGTHTETDEKLVVYKALYGTGKIWIRPYDLFMSEVPSYKKNPTKQKYRFEVYEPESKSQYQLGD